MPLGWGTIEEEIGVNIGKEYITRKFKAMIHGRSCF